ncbi:hypothetical protein GWK47_040903 [Chionoecetes opilio]|uniref:Uncharacterized protein n=1 Tax=Chionoecetes opilio TaxID=41210 RepID=A0A8J4YAB9_CHIOP|nr:hypothetical protein GWK47_040903 [Chionoecetes opilio]
MVVSRVPRLPGQQWTGGCGLVAFSPTQEAVRFWDRGGPRAKVDATTSNTFAKKGLSQGLCHAKGSQIPRQGREALALISPDTALLRVRPPSHGFVRASHHSEGWTASSVRPATGGCLQTPQTPPGPPSPVRAGESSRLTGHRRDGSRRLCVFHKARCREWPHWLGYEKPRDSRPRGARRTVLYHVVMQWRWPRSRASSTPPPLWGRHLQDVGTFSRKLSLTSRREHTSVKLAGQSRWRLLKPTAEPSDTVDQVTAKTVPQQTI